MKTEIFGEGRKADTVLTGLQFLRWLEERESAIEYLLETIVGYSARVGDGENEQAPLQTTSYPALREVLREMVGNAFERFGGQEIKPKR